MVQRIGLTGGIASGKSTVSNLLKKNGFTIIDADIASRAVVEPGEEAYHKIIEAFGKEILAEDDTINRKQLGTIIFHDDAKRHVLNSIVHPAVRSKMNEWKDAAVKEGKQTIIYDIPLLFESRLTYLVERTIVVYVHKEIQIKRLMERNQFSKEEAVVRISTQMPLEEKVQLADVVIDNSGTIRETEVQILDLIEQWGLKP